MFDTAIAIWKDLFDILSCKLPVQLLNDKKNIFHVRQKGSRTSEKRTILDIPAAREGFQDHAIYDNGFVWSQPNLADKLIKTMSQAAIRNDVTSGVIKYAI